MHDKYVEVTHQSWFSRIGNAIKGVIIGFILIFVGIGLLFWNEGRAVKTHRALVESQSQVVSISADNAQPSMNGKLVHVSGNATTEQTLNDDMLPISAQALKLKRYVETYQWKESSKSEEKKQLGGSTETVTTYEYQKVWSESKISSANFKQQAGHENPAVYPYETRIWTADTVTIGDYTLSDAHKADINNFQSLEIPQVAMPQGLRHSGQQLYYGADPNNPKVGDQRIRFEVVMPQTFSVVGRLSGAEITEHVTSNGRTIALIEVGSLTADAMFEQAKSENSLLTWILRAAGTLLLMMAFSMILKPLSVVADVVPAIGSIVEMGTGFVSMVVALIIALVTICVAWIFYRPLVAVALLVVVAGLVYWLSRRAKTASANKAATSTVPLESTAAAG